MSPTTLLLSLALLSVACQVGTSIRLICRGDQFDCWGDGMHCIPNTKRCDGHVDCPQGADEYGCRKPYVKPTPKPGGCTADEFDCDGNAGYNCIPKSKQCDGYFDCMNGSDEGFPYTDCHANKGN